jgi:hypothetical protein
LSISQAGRQLFNQRQIPYIKPFYSLDWDNDEDILDWFRSSDTKLVGFYSNLFTEQKQNLKTFYNNQVSNDTLASLVAGNYQNGISSQDDDDININEMFLLVMDQVSTIVSNELTSQVLPNNDDYKDKIASKYVKMWLNSMSYDLDIDLQRVKWEIQKKIFGESFVIPRWNKDIGDFHPASKEMRDETLDLVDEEGNKVKDEQGNSLEVDKYQRIGDIELINPLPWDVMIDPKDTYKDSNWFYYIKYEETDYLEREYPDINFGTGNETSKYDSFSGSTKNSPNHTKVFYFYHRSHKFLQEGAYIVCTENDILLKSTLENDPTIVVNQKLPLIRFVSSDIGYGVRGVPLLFRNAYSAVEGYNVLTNQIFRNLEMESPKIMVHQSAGVDAQRMPDGSIVIEWKGNIKPSIEVPQTNTSSIFKFREDLKKNILELGGQTPMVRGDTPNAQLDSFIALQHFEDQRVQLATPDIKSHIKCIEHLYQLLISIAKDHYDPEDGRMMKIVGKNNIVNLKFFEPENLGKVYDVIITTTGNLANSKAARTQLIMTIKREFPAIISDDVFIDMLSLSSSEKFENAITAAVNSSQAENEEMLSGEAIPAPESYEDLITHWDIHRIAVQGREFKLAPPEIQILLETHITATEKLMYDQARLNPTFNSYLAGLKQFPMLYAIPLEIEQQPGQEQQIEDVDLEQGELGEMEQEPLPQAL